MIEGAVAAYKATETGSPDTTVANTLAALDELKKGGRSYEKAVARLGHDCSGVDYTTHHALQDLAKAVARHEVGAREALNQAASARAEQLRQHVRVNTETESLRFFCGVLRLIFNNAASSTVRGSSINPGIRADALPWRSSRLPASNMLISSRTQSG
jgi:hypothetical protein